ncbi:efflux RND transporter permease subunit [Actomonas aquatica]|uniref:Efflux RND transporter permease subunit n=1 Tax=Actomonas aquatica TaxID=2866162 RepID=A0ABZ1C4U1_9BACT|nr:efflux RND transporter permease subunit [Opitutus sp. WL0086]WRQ86343.1 efflux RND transporter permease subunit [Opitutus sp. WL0086]
MSDAPTSSTSGDAPKPPRFGMTGRLAAMFIDSKLTPIAVIASILLGIFAVLQLPREEEPQIKVPMIDVLVGMPGARPTEVENRVTRPVEKLLWEIPDVEYLYSTSEPGGAMIIVRFTVGTDIEAALIRLNQKLQANYDLIPPGVSQPLIKPRTIDDVPILALTLHSATHDHLTLRRLGAQLDEAVKSVDQVAETTLIGGVRRAVRVALDPAALAARNLTADTVARAVQAANRATQAGSRPFANTEILLETGAFLRDAQDVGLVVVGAFQNRPIYLRDVATISDTAEEPANYVLHGQPGSNLEAAVTLSVAKRPGANAIDVVNQIMAKVDTLRGTLLPADVELTVTRDYGHTAAEKSNELLLHMGIAVFGVAILILFFLGWRESLVVLLAIPSTLALTLLVFYLYGYTLNRITLFALIFSIGILVDDAIVVVENIVRHVRLPSSRHKSLVQVALEAVDEVGNPTVLATWAVIAAILPMAFVGGLMGPYMRPIPIGSTAAMLFSLVIAFTITPWAALRVLKRHVKSKAENPESKIENHGGEAADWSTRLYHKVMDPLLDYAWWRWAFLITIVGLLAGSAALVLFGMVKIKMLPFDNKSEFQIVINTPEGTSLEETTAIAQEMATAIAQHPEVRDYQIYSGTASPFNFNGLVRHYFMRRGPNVADIQVNLVGKHDRADQSHDIAKRIRPDVAAIAQKHGAAVAVAEVPPGPPVLQSIVAEIYGPSDEQRVALARKVKDIMANTTGIVDLDWYVEAPQPKVTYIVDKEKAALHGISTATISRTLAFAAQGHEVDLLHQPDEREDVPITLELPAGDRTTPQELLALHVRSDLDPTAPLVPLSELVRIEHSTRERSLYRKNLKAVTYVTADVAGEVESPAYALFDLHMQLLDLDAREYGATDETLDIYHLNLPADDTQPALKWDGEWHITLEVFRDLGIAFAAVLVLIAMLMVGWFRSYMTPLVVMAAIPFSLIGILPAHWLMGAFFTATSMIGFMAGAGIVVRNSIILVDFIELRRSEGLSLRNAVVEAGAVRFRPMLLTALAVVVGASVILADPIFQGLAISLMFGEIASLAISRMAVPVLYFMANQEKKS